MYSKNYWDQLILQFVGKKVPEKSSCFLGLLLKPETGRDSGGMSRPVLHTKMRKGGADVTRTFEHVLAYTRA